MPLPEDVKRIIHEIKHDKTSGSSILARKSLEAFKELTKTEFNDDDVVIVSQHIAGLRPSMPLIKAFATRVVKNYMSKPRGDKSERGLALITACKEVEEEYGRKIAEVVRNSAEALKGMISVTTLSYSGTVVKVLSSLEDVKRVNVLESRPMMEGRRIAEALKERKEVILYVDAAMQYAVKSCDAIILGADSILKNNGFVGKIGCFPLCLSAREYSKPVYVISDSWKIMENTVLETIEEEGEPGEVWSCAEGVKVRNPYFEFIPDRLVSYYITDTGVDKRF